jgi:hypothetical protein
MRGNILIARFRSRDRQNVILQTRPVTMWQAAA